MYILNIGLNEIERRDNTGKWTKIQGPDASIGSCGFAMAVDNAGTIYITDTDNNKILCQALAVAVGVGDENALSIVLKTNKLIAFH